MAILTLYGSNVADAQLSTACDMAVASGGTETSSKTISTGANTYVEITSQGSAGLLTVAAIPTTPTGKGWVYQPGAGTFAAGDWAASVTIAADAWSGSSATTNVTFRFSRYAGGVYTSIGSLPAQAISGTAKTTYTLTAASLASITFGASDLLSIDGWWFDASGAINDNPSIYLSSSATAGIAGDLVVTTAPFTPVAAPRPRYILRALGSTIIPDPVSQPLAYVRRALGSTLIYENRTFIPRALGGVYIPDTVMWVPRGISSTVQAALLRSLTLAGTGTLAGTFSLATALSATFAGVGTLSGTLSANTALSVTLAGVGTLNGTLSANTALSTTCAGVGTLAGTLSTTGGGSAALTAECDGVGTLTGTLSAKTALSSTLAGSGTLTGMLSLATALAGQLPGVGTLSGVFTLRTALSLTFAGRGTLAGILTLPVLAYLSTTCVTRDMQAVARTRDMQATCVTRDERGTANSRDMQALALTRDEQAIAKTRS